MENRKDWKGSERHIERFTCFAVNCRWCWRWCFKLQVWQQLAKNTVCLRQRGSSSPSQDHQLICAALAPLDYQRRLCAAWQTGTTLHLVVANWATALFWQVSNHPNMGWTMEENWVAACCACQLTSWPPRERNHFKHPHLHGNSVNFATVWRAQTFII